MNELKNFVDTVRAIGWSDSSSEALNKARRVVSELNRFLFSTHSDIGVVEELGREVPYFSDFHKFWHRHHKEILAIQISEDVSVKIADALHDVYVQTNGRAFHELYPTYGLSLEEFCRVRMLTANQDFRGSRNFSELAQAYEADPTLFDVDGIVEDPERFLHGINVINLSQSDKRVHYAQRFAKFVQDHGGSPFGLIDVFGRDITRLRAAILECDGAGYGNKKTDMVLRDMIVQGVWTDVIGFESLDVASDVNTIGVALRTGLLHSEIPLVSSFLDQFCYQYGYVDEMNAMAWRRVWEMWHQRHPDDDVASPCLLDYFIYRVVGKQLCKKSLCVFSCAHGHVFKWHSAHNQTCQQCAREGRKRQSAILIDRVMPCDDAEGYIAIKMTEYVKSGAAPEGFSKCPFVQICQDRGHKSLQPPKSISIYGQTGWMTAYARDGDGGGGLMA